MRIGLEAHWLYFFPFCKQHVTQLIIVVKAGSGGREPFRRPLHYLVKTSATRDVFSPFSSSKSDYLTQA